MMLFGFFLTHFMWQNMLFLVLPLLLYWFVSANEIANADSKLDVYTEGYCETV